MLLPKINTNKKIFNLENPIRLFIVGATGSIGSSTLEIVRRFPSLFKVVGLTAHSNQNALQKLSEEFKADFSSTSNELIIEQLHRGNYDIMVAAASGIAGLEGVLAALQSGKQVALANKESLVAGGKLVSSLVKQFNGTIIPVDSEHSAIFQSIQGSEIDEINTITLTASGGPFLNTALKDLKHVTPAEAVKHPKWSMGRKISVDSATMFNKGLELIEAYWLFGIEPERIEVVIHPQSILHSMVNFNDGSSIAQLSIPDMKGAISYALNYPNKRLTEIVPKLSLTTNSPLEFFEIDNERFPAIKLAREALNRGSAAPAVYNAANEAAVSLFLEDKLKFDLISEQVASSLEQFGSLDYSTLAELRDIDRTVREYIKRKVGKT